MKIVVAEDELPLERLYRWERERPDRVFLTQPCGGGKVRDWSWAQAASEIRHMAGYLNARGLEPGAHIAILSKNCAWWVMADLAVWMAGHVSVPIYPSLRGSTVRQILAHSGARACFLGATDDKEIGESGIPAEMECISFPTAAAPRGANWDSAAAGSQPIPGNPTRTAGELATILYTSGTTGVPKGVMHNFGSFAFLSKSLAQVLDLATEHRAFSYLPLAHVLERAALEVPAVVFGWHVFFNEGLESFLADLQRARPTIFLTVPRLLLKLQQGVFDKISQSRLETLQRVPIAGRFANKRVLHGLGLNAARYAACGGAPLPVELLLWYRKLGLNLMEGYGMTETSITHLPRAGKIRPGYVGNALDGVEAKRSAEGELLLKSPMNMMGYYKDPEGTRAAFTEDGFFRTGDLVEIDTDGQMKIIGRLKEQFKTSKGKYVAPAPIESKLVAHPDIESCCLIGTGLARPFAVAILSAEARERCAAPQARSAIEESLSEQLEQLNAELDSHERVLFLAIVDGPWSIANELMTPTFKLRRAPLERFYLEKAGDWAKQGRPVVWETAPGSTSQAM
jgi:long-chain acyl-CoA synthetase